MSKLIGVCGGAEGLIEEARPPEVVPSTAGQVEAPPPGKVGRFVFIDGLRGVAAMWVVLFHAYEGKHLTLITEKMPAWVGSVFNRGWYGVPIFFVLSGFVIAYSVSRYRVNLGFIGRFALRRSIRLDPPYWASMVVAIGLAYLSSKVLPGRQFLPPRFADVVAHLFYLEDVLGYHRFLDVYWTLCFEIQFYLLFCLLMWLVHSTRRDESDKRSLFLVFGPAMLVASLWPLELIRDILWPGLCLFRWHGFLLGVLACWAMQRTISPAWFGGYALIMAVAGIWNRNEFPVVCAVTASLIWLATRSDGLYRWLGWRWLQFLGLISYSLYLFHNPITGVFYQVGYRVSGRSWASEGALFFPMIAVNVAVAGGVWWLLEKPSLALAHQVKFRRDRSTGVA